LFLHFWKLFVDRNLDIVYIGSEGADVGLASVVDAMRFFLRPGGSPANLLEDLARAVNQAQTLRDLVGSGRSLLAIANSSRPEYER